MFGYYFVKLIMGHEQAIISFMKIEEWFYLGKTIQWFRIITINNLNSLIIRTFWQMLYDLYSHVDLIYSLTSVHTQ